MITRWPLIKNCIKERLRFDFVCQPWTKNNSCMFFFSALHKKVLIPSMKFANYSKSKNLSVGKVCIKRFEFACMTILNNYMEGSGSATIK